MKDKSLALISTIAAFLASLSCLGPLLLGGAGLGAALEATFAPLRPYFLAVSADSIGWGILFRLPEAKTLRKVARERRAHRRVELAVWRSPCSGNARETAAKYRPHKFRANYCTKLLQSGIDLKTVQKLMGHKTIESTMRYLAKAGSKRVRAKVNAVQEKPSDDA